MTLEYIRRHYKVPAKRGAKIEYTGNVIPIPGVIVGSRGQYLRVRLEGESHTHIFHPTWNITYLED